MKLLRKVEHEGQFWAERQDGTWVRWSERASAWEPAREAPPWLQQNPWATAVPEGPPGGGSWAEWAPGIGPDGMPKPNIVPEREQGPPEIDLIGGPQFPKMPWDDWFNRTFPPYSSKRILFGVFMLPIVGAIYWLVQNLRGQSMSFGLYLFVTIAGIATLGLLWFSGVLKTPEKRAQTSTLEPRERVPVRGPDVFMADVLICLPISFVGTTILNMFFSGVGDALSPSSLGLSLLAALMVSALIALRDSIWAVVIVSVIAGAGIALVLEILTIFLSDGSSFYLTWLLSSLLVLACALPYWYASRRFGLGVLGRIEATIGRPVPMWVIVTGTYMLAIGAVAFVGI